MLFNFYLKLFFYGGDTFFICTCHVFNLSCKESRYTWLDFYELNKFQFLRIVFNIHVKCFFEFLCHISYLYYSPF